MPEFRKQLDVNQGFNFKKDKTTPFGFMTKFSIPKISLIPDIQILNAQNERINVCAVLNDVLWQLGQTDPIYFGGQVSDKNRRLIYDIANLQEATGELSFEFEVFDYDPISKKYYLCFHSNKTTLNGLFEKRGYDFNLTVAEDPSPEVQAPPNFSFMTGIKPIGGEQTLSLATGDQKNLVKSWGVPMPKFY